MKEDAPGTAAYVITMVTLRLLLSYLLECTLDMSDMDTQFSGLRSHAHTFEISSKVYNLITDTFYC